METYVLMNHRLFSKLCSSFGLQTLGRAFQLSACGNLYMHRPRKLSLTELAGCRECFIVYVITQTAFIVSIFRRT